MVYSDREKAEWWNQAIKSGRKTKGQFETWLAKTGQNLVAALLVFPDAQYWDTKPELPNVPWRKWDNAEVYPRNRKSIR